MYGVAARASTSALELRIIKIEMQLEFMSGKLTNIFDLLELRIKGP